MNTKQQVYYNDLLRITQQKGWRVLSDRYQRMDAKMTFSCEKGHIFDTQPRYVLQERACLRCSGKTLEQGNKRFIEEVTKKGGIILGTYTGHHGKVLLQCKFNHRWEVKPGDLYAGDWCHSCFLDIAKNKFLQKVKDHNGKVLDEYLGTRTKIRVQCEKGHIWEVKPTNIINNTWCPNCNESRGEHAIRVYLSNSNISYIQQGVIKSLPRRRFDFIIQYKNENIIIEFDGNQHFEMVPLFHKTEEEFQRRQAVDRVKTALALYSGYKVIRIDYSQLNNIEFHLNRALTRLDPLYVSTHKLYDKWMLNTIISYKQYLELR